jgi:hypothetical protein
MADDDRDSGSSGTKTILIVLAAVGGIVLLGVLACAGLFGFAIFQVSNQVKGIFGSTQSSIAFLQNLNSKQIDLAYQMGSTRYKQRVSRAQFDEFLAKHPRLTDHRVQSQLYKVTPDPKAKPQTAVMLFTLADPKSSGVATVDDEDDDAKPPAAKTPPVPPKPPGETVQLRISLTEENGNWVIDDVVVE